MSNITGPKVWHRFEL